jgi:hypothetical protein
MPDVLDQLRESGQRLVDAAAARPADLDAVMARGRATRRRRTGTIALCSLLAIALAVGAIAASATGHHAAPLLHTTAPATHTRPQPKPTPGPMDQQLAASLGVGVPNGWVPVDFGNARLWLPPTTTVFGAKGCGASAAGTDLTLAFDPIAAGCNLATVSWIATSQLRSGARQSRASRTIHGYPIYVTPRAPGVAIWDVPALGITLQYRIVSKVPVDQVLDTLAPSAQAIAARSDLTIDTLSWRTVSWHGDEWKQPSTWAVRDLAGSPAPCAQAVRRADVTEVGTSTLQLPCTLPAISSDRVRPPVDGASVAQCESCDGLTAQQGQLVRALHSTAITVTLGIDGRVGAAVARSFHAVHDSGTLRVDGCPNTVPRDRTPGQRFARLVPGHPTAVAICRYHGAGVTGTTLNSLAAFAPGDVAHWQTTLNALRPVTKALCNGQNDNGPHVTLHFTYAQGAPTDVTVGSPCGYATNGHGISYTSPALLDELGTRVGADCRSFGTSVSC